MNRRHWSPPYLSRATAVLIVLATALYMLGYPPQVAFAAAPTVSAVSPAAGPTAGGTVITITGTGFVVGATVTIGGNPATDVNVNSGTSITATTPAAAGPGPVVVIVTTVEGSGTLGNGFTYSGPPPAITGISPTTGSTLGGTVVTITGAGFMPNPVVLFGAVPATGVTFVGSGEVRATAPAQAAGSVTVLVRNTDSQEATFNSFTYQPAPAPTVTSVSPTSGSTGGGTSVTITGTNFAAGATVTFGTSGNTAATSVQVVSSTTITALTPARSAGTVSVAVRNPDTQTGTLANAFTYVSTPAPTVTTVSPTGGPSAGGNTVTIIGTNFLPGATVRFGSNNATVTSLAGSTTITAVAPAGSGTVTVTVTNVDGKSGSKSSAYAYTAGPTVSSISPATVSTVGGTQITINGSNFAVGVTVTVNGVSATSVTRVSASRITANVPAGNAGLALVVVRNPDGQQALVHDKLSYVAGPVIASISPNSGSTLGGTAITITGTGFVANSKVRIDGRDATSVVIVNSTRITAVTPSGTLGAKPVDVVPPSGLTGRLNNGFTYTQPTGSFVGGQVSKGGLGLVIFSGGTNAQLTAAATAAGCAIQSTTFFVTHQGTWIGYIPATQIAVVNAQWNAHFANGIPNQVMLIRCG